MTTTNMDCERIFNRPAYCQSFIDGFTGHPCLCSPIRNAHRDAIQRQATVSSGITQLFVRSGPLAVIRRIPEVVVFSFYTVGTGRTWPHVLVKRRKGVAPSLTDCNSPPSIALEAWASGVCTSTAHVYPYPILSRVRHPMNSMRGRACDCSKATATGGVFLNKVAALRDALFTALALAQPSRWFDTIVAYDSQSPKSLPRQIFHSGRNYDRIMFSHLNLLHRFKVVRAVSELELRYRSLLLQNTLAA